MIVSEVNPFAWDRCDHSGIGQPGCQTCDPDKHRCLQRARYVAYVEVTEEREACAALADDLYEHGEEYRIATAIRARGTL